MKRYQMPILVTILLNFFFNSGLLAQSNLLDAHLHGKVRSGLTAQGLPGVEVKYIQLTPEPDTIITYTNIYGEYNFTIVGVKEHEQTENIDGIKFFPDRIEAKQGEKNIQIFDIIGQKVLEINEQNKTITPNIKNLADGLYPIKIKTNGESYTNTLNILGGKIIGARKHTENISDRAGIKKITDKTFLLEFRDTTGQHYLYLVLDPHTLTQNQVYNTPLLPKGQLAIPFYDSVYYRYIDDNRELLLDLVGAYFMPAVAYLTTFKPLKVHLNQQELPSYYNIVDVRHATLEMMTETGLPIDSIYQETSTYLDPRFTTESTIGYQYLDNGSMQGFDAIIGNIINAQTLKRSYLFQFNKETIEPQISEKVHKMGLVLWNSRDRSTC